MSRLYPVLLLLCFSGCGEQVFVALLDDQNFSTDPVDDVLDSASGSDDVRSTEADSNSVTSDVCTWMAPYETDVPIRGVWGLSAADVWAVGGNDQKGGQIFHFNGREWSQVEPDESVIDLAFSVNGVWSVETGGIEEVFFAHDFGVLKATVERNQISWNVELDTSKQLPAPLESMFDAKWLSVFGTSNRDVYVVGGTENVPFAGGTIAHYNGDQWTDMVGGAKVDLGINSIHDVHGFGGSSPVFGVSASPMNYGQILQYADDWNVEHQVVPNFVILEWTGFYGVWGRAVDDIYAVGSRALGAGLFYNGVILHRTADNRWLPMDLKGKLDYAELRGVWGRSDKNSVIVVGKKGSSGLAFKYNGSVWSEMFYEDENPFAFPLNRLWGDSGGNLFIVGDRGIYYCLKSRIS